MKRLLILLLFPLIPFAQDNNEILGCTDSSAINYDSNATEDDGSCCYNEQSWVQSQEFLDSDLDQTGFSISYSNDGTTVAIGSPDYDNDDTPGKVTIYYKENNQWSQIGSSINGYSNGDWFGYSVSLNADGTKLAVGAPGGPGDKGYVRTFTLVGGEWVQLAEDITYEDQGYWQKARIGFCISLSHDGSRLAIGAPEYGDDWPGSTEYEIGVVKIFDLNNENWSQIGSDLFGQGSYWKFGHLFSLSGDGSSVIISNKFGDGGTSEGSSVTIYSLFENDWVQIGQSIPPLQTIFYTSIDINFDGSIILLGQGKENLDGNVRAFTFEGNDWVQLGSTIYGDTQERLGYSVSINSSGDLFAAGAIEGVGFPYNLSNIGSVKIFNFNDDWQQLGETIYGNYQLEQSGWEVSLNGDGSSIAIGSPQNTALGLGQTHGSFRIFDFILNENCSNSIIYGCTYSIACNFDSTANVDNGVCIFPEQYYDCDGNPLNDGDGNGVADELEQETILIGDVDCSGEVNSQDAALILQYVTNVIDSLPCSYALINIDDQALLGCTDENASNYNNLATEDDGSCDTDGDGVADIDEVFGCTYENDPNYNELATEDDGSCEPYVGMYGFGGVIYKIIGNTAYIINVDYMNLTAPHPSTTNLSNTVSELFVSGFDDWYVPNTNDFDDICDEKALINIVSAANNGILILNDQSFWTSSSWCTQSWPSYIPWSKPYGVSECYAYGGTNCPLNNGDFYLIVVRQHIF